ncbi:triple QxxK/R motif-containing protein-like [Strongylocentrotus purpuratus]|uniref:Triple QxxK/R motif-containing protein n=1 Tax=Strongylocentrotus purpuratus TaxID=7668 RepID=A0A7M7HNA7_STRPU|nr:triple QxxK/R motif-containing protein-like [Strongylocentrotus purpuratus]|eukprot:XP_011669757.1 PREDICTED: triple QxxK/R motif-containing protein-like [Strongylocentrotus purpuratus]
MGKKDAAQRTHLSVDQYRKNIGKHEQKRTKKDVNRMKNEAQIRKEGFRFQETFLVILSLLAAVMLIYALFYFQITPKD